MVWGDILYYGLCKNWTRGAKNWTTFSDRSGYWTLNFISCLYFIYRSISIVRNLYRSLDRNNKNVLTHITLSLLKYTHNKIIKLYTHNKIIKLSLFHCNFAAEAVLRSCSLRSLTSLKKRLWHKWFSCEFCEIFNITFFKEHRWWLLLLQI